VNLTQDEYYSGGYKTQFSNLAPFKNFKKAVSCGAATLKQKKDGSCIYLKNNRCLIHKIRPKACRAFYCSSKAKKYQSMITQINTYKKREKI